MNNKNRYYFDVMYNYGEIRVVEADSVNEAYEKLRKKLELHIVEDYTLFKTEPLNEQTTDSDS